MTPQEIEAWFAQHGGQAAVEGPDANGITTYRAADGNYVNVRRDGSLALRGFSPPTGASAQAAAPASTPAPSSGGGMNQSEVEQWIAQNGGQGRVQYSRSSQRVTNPAGSAVLPDGTDNPAYDPMAPKVIDVNEEKWTAVDDKGQPTGAVLHVRRRDDGNFDIVQQANPNPTKPQAGTRTPTEQAADAKAQQEQKEREKNAALPKDQDPRYETDAERDARAKATIATQRQQGIDAQAAAEKQAADKRAEEAAARQNAPKPEKDANGNWGYWDTKPGQQPVWVPITGGPQAQMKPVEINGQYGVWQPGPDGVPVWKPVAAPPAGTTFKNVEPFQPDFTQPDLGIGKWSQTQRAKIGLPAEQGGITETDYKNAALQAHEQATVTVTNLTSANSVQRQRMIDEQNERQQRSSEAAGDFNSAVGVFNQVWKYADPATGSIRNLIPGLMNEQAKYRKEREGQASPPPPLHPMFQQMIDQTKANPTPPSPTGPSSAPSSPTPPNALGLGAIGNVPAPGGAPAAPAPLLPPPPAATNIQPAAPDAGAPPAPAPVAPTQPWDSQPGAPMMPPAPPAGVPALPTTPAADPLINVRHKTTGAVSQMTLSAFNALPDRGDYEVFDPNSSGMATPGPAAPAVGPQPTDQPNGLPPGQSVLPPDNGYGPAPSMLPPNEVTQAPTAGPLTAFAQSALAPAQQAAAPMPNGPMSGLPQQTSSVFNPMGTANRMVAMGVPHDVIAQALAEMGMVA